MKKTLILLIAIVISCHAFAQWATSGSDISNTNTGNVGIGITSPTASLHIANYNRNTPYFQIDDSYGPMTFGIMKNGYNGWGATLWSWPSSGTNGGNLAFATGNGTFDPNNSIRMLIDQAGNVGIGTTSPAYKLHVDGSAVLFDTGTDSRIIFGSTGSGNPYMASYNDAMSAFANLKLYGGNIILNGDAGGNVVIGTNTPATGYKLSVNGNVIAESMRIMLHGSWPDYVFAPAYRLSTLAETAAFIQSNRHLPGIPSAEEVKNNGIDLGEMNAKLLKKVEELTLYMIEQQKQNELQNAQIKILQQKLEALLPGNH